MLEVLVFGPSMDEMRDAGTCLKAAVAALRAHRVKKEK